MLSGNWFCKELYGGVKWSVKINNIKYTFSISSHYELWQAKYILVQLQNSIKKTLTNKGIDYH